MIPSGPSQEREIVDTSRDHLSIIFPMHKERFQLKTGQWTSVLDVKAVNKVSIAKLGDWQSGQADNAVPVKRFESKSDGGEGSDLFQHGSPER